MKLLNSLFATVLMSLSFLVLGAGPVYVGPPVGQTNVAGAMLDAGSVISLLNQIVNNAAPGPGDFAFNTNTSGAVPLTPAQVINGLWQQTTTNASLTMPLGTNLIAALPGGTGTPSQLSGRTFNFLVFNTLTAATTTIVTNTGITLIGTMATQLNTARWFLGTVLSTGTGVSLQSVAAFPITL